MEAECKKCGTVYRTEGVLSKLPASSDLVRDKDGIYQRRACLCEQNSYGHAESYTLLIKFVRSDYTIGTYKAPRSWSTGRTVLLKVEKRTPKTITFKLVGGSHVVVDLNGRGRGKDSKGYIVESPELQLAIDQLEGKIK